MKRFCCMTAKPLRHSRLETGFAQNGIRALPSAVTIKCDALKSFLSSLCRATSMAPVAVTDLTVHDSQSKIHAICILILLCNPRGIHRHVNGSCFGLQHLSCTQGCLLYCGLLVGCMMSLTILFVHGGAEGLCIFCRQEGAHPPCEDVPDHQRPLKRDPLVWLIPLQWRGCSTANMHHRPDVHP